MYKCTYVPTPKTCTHTHLFMQVRGCQYDLINSGSNNLRTFSSWIKIIGNILKFYLTLSNLSRRRIRAPFLHYLLFLHCVSLVNNSNSGLIFLICLHPLMSPVSRRQCPNAIFNMRIHRSVGLYVEL